LNLDFKFTPTTNHNLKIFKKFFLLKAKYSDPKNLN